MGKYLTLFSSHTSYDEYINGPDAILPNVSYCEDVKDVHFNPYVHDYSKDYLTTIARENGTISFNIWKNMGTDYITSISYSTNGGETWTTTQNQNNKSEHLVIDVSVNEGDKVLWKGIAQQTGYLDEDEWDYVGSFFSSTAEFDAEGNVMSLLYGDNFIGEAELEYNYQFAHLFHDYEKGKECLIVNAENLSLPATTLAVGCYENMFRGCTSLTTAPELPATTLATRCYQYMFSGCTNLTTAPTILPATTLAYGCYEYMFNGCTSLTTAPELPATTLAVYCYYEMFYGCTNLNQIKCLATDISASSCTDAWVAGVASTGTFVKSSNISELTWGRNASGIPNNWTVQDAS